MKKFLIRWAIKLAAFVLLTLGMLPVMHGVNSETARYAIIILTPFVIGALSCGWICPAGFLQDALFRKKLEIKVPDRLHKYLRLLRYVFAGLMVSGLFVFPGLIMRAIGDIAVLKFSAGFVLYAAVASLIVSIFINRFFCRYVCPYGAMNGIRSLVRPITIKRDAKVCIKCKICDKKCPMKIKVSEIKSCCSPNCIACFKCMEHCPKRALYLGLRDYKSK